MSTGFHPSFVPLCVHSISFLLIGALRPQRTGEEMLGDTEGRTLIEPCICVCS